MVAVAKLIALKGGSLDDVLVVSTHCKYDKDVPANQGEYLGKMVRYWCEGCGYAHQIGVQSPNEEPYKGGPSWPWNGSLTDPVLSPSQLHRTYHWPKDGTPEEQAEADALLAQPGGTERMMVHPKFGHTCHTFIGINGAPPGHIIYLSDCTHGLRGQVRRLLPRREWPDRWWARVAVSDAEEA